MTATATTTPNINDTFAGEDIDFGAVDYTAPEQGSRRPAVKPGLYTGIFELAPESPFETKTIKGQPHMQVNFNITGIQTEGEAGDPRTVRFQRVTSYKSEKMKNSGISELIRSLGLTVEGSLTKFKTEELLTGASGRTAITVEFGWRASTKNEDGSYTEATTFGKKNSTKWPRTATGEFEDTVTLNGQQLYGKVEVVNFKLPRA